MKWVLNVYRTYKQKGTLIVEADSYDEAVDKANQYMGYDEDCIEDESWEGLDEIEIHDDWGIDFVGEIGEEVQG